MHQGLDVSSPLFPRNQERVPTLEETKEDVGGDGTLVRLVEHEHAVLAHVGVDEALSLEHAVRHVLDLGIGTRAVLEPDRVPDFLAEAAPDLFGDALGDRHGGDSTRLRAANLEPVGVPGFGEVLRHLRRLARPGVADNDEDLILFRAGKEVTTHGKRMRITQGNARNGSMISEGEQE